MEKQIKYSKKISQFEKKYKKKYEIINIPKNFIFDEKTINIINEQINYYSFLKSTLKEENIIKIYDSIIITIGENKFRYIKDSNCLISYQDIPMILLVNEILKNTDNTIKLYSDDVKKNTIYLGFIKNCVILGYLYILNYSHIIDFNCLDDLNPITQKIVEMVNL